MKTFTAFAAILLSSFAMNLAAADNDHWDAQFGAPGIDGGTVYCVEPNGNDIYMGGVFNAAGGAVSSGIARWDGSNWTGLAGGVSGASAVVYAVAPHGADIYVGGYFTSAGPVAAKSLARWDGSGWATVGGGVNGLVFSLRFLGNDLFVGGNFTKAGNVNATNIARWDGTNWWALGDGLNGNTNGFYPYVHSLTTDTNGNLFAAGLFRFAGVLAVNNVARWNGTSWSALGGGLFNGSSPIINDVKFYNGSLYAAGSFRSAGGVNATNLARWDGSQWFALGGGPSGTNNALAFVGTNLYTVGTFTNIGGVKMLNCAHWNGAAWEPVAAGAAGEISTEAACAGSGGGMFYAGGSFVRAGNAGILGIARWDGSQWLSLNGSQTKGIFLTAREVRVVGSDIYVGSSGMLLAGGAVASRIARWDGANWDAMGGGVIGGGNVSSSSATVASIVESGGQIYAGGNFTNISGVKARSVARWDGANWYPLASGFNNVVNALVFHQGQLFAGGNFTARGDGTGSLHGIAVWDGSEWQDVPLIESWRINNSITALASDGSSLYAGGNFYFGWGFSPAYPVGDNIDNIGRWDGSFWHSMGSSLAVTVNALTVYNGDLYAGGSFTTNAAGTALKRIARWDGSSWNPVSGGFTNGTISALAASATALYAGGSFTNQSGVSMNRIAKWDGSQWFALGSGATNTASSTSGTVSAIAVAGDDVYLAGAFNRAGGKPALAFARWNETVSFAPPPVIRLLNPRWQAGQFRFEIGGLDAGAFSVLASTNLMSWDAIYSGSVPNTNFADPDSPSLPQRSYRVSSP